METLTYAVHTFVDNCVTGITANRERCRDMVEHSVGIITALCPHVGYEKAAEVAKRAIETRCAGAAGSFWRRACWTRRPWTKFWTPTP